jgi:hypothetical protein
MAVAYSTPGVHRPSDLEEIIVVSTTGVASNGDPVPMKSALSRVWRRSTHLRASFIGKLSK